MMWFDDIVVGDARNLGTHTFVQDEIIAFAEKYDPQPIHIDPEAAKASAFGGLIASGWHTVAMWMRMAVKDRQPKTGEVGETPPADISPGFEDLRWQKPVRPGTTLTFTTEVVRKVDLKSRPELGLVLSHNEARGPDGDLYMSFTGKLIVLRNPVGG